jgi:tRNA1Val (adenine37-N6)-methyltransferase
MRDETEFEAVDLGCGLGSVLMLVAWAFPTIHLTGVEAQASRASRARRSLRFNGASSRCRVLDGDLRDTSALAGEVGSGARLVTGTPPYFDAGATNWSSDAEAAACRVEIRGGLEVYLEAGAAVMAPDGHLVLCYPASSGERARLAARARGLEMTQRLCVIPAVNKPPLIVVDRFARNGVSVVDERELIVRDATGQWTEEFRSVRRRFGMPDRAAT